MTLRQIGNYLLAIIIAVIVTYISCLIRKIPLTLQEIYNLIALVALLRTMKKY